VTPTLINIHKKLLLERGLATGTARHYFVILNAMFNVAVSEWELLSVSPMKKVRKPVPSPDRTNYLTEEQCEQFLTTCKQEKNRQFSVAIPKNRLS
jgi:integrase